MSVKLPLIIEPSELKKYLNSDDVLIIDLSSPATYVQYHIPGAVFLNYEWIVRVEQPRMGLLPTEEQLNNVLGSLGLTTDKHVVVYDDEGGGRACRFLWTLDVAGHKNFSLLNGGLQAWSNHGNKISSTISYPTPCEYKTAMNFEPVATRQYILDHLSDDNVVILDTRNPAEFNGSKVFAQRGGHIPGAINIEWTDAMDKAHDMRLKPESELRKMLEDQGMTTDKTIVTHCQTHHRSAHTYIMLKSLGYKKIKGYPGSWSDWGNEPNTPIE
ncbi:MAG: sulfurtransferase [Gammaproteobacteria bacterium]|nr:sulfurtransferase [Gammaproteobacteria bacterium]